MNAATQKSVANLAAALVVAMFCVGAFAVVSAYQGRLTIWHSQLAGCKRGKLDRTDNADFQSAYAKYNSAVSGAPNSSVKKDIRDAAALLRQTVRHTAPSLRSRTGNNLNCDAAFPRPSLF